MKRMRCLMVIAALAWPCIAAGGTIQESSVGATSTPATAGLPSAASVQALAPAPAPYDAEAPIVKPAAPAVTKPLPPPAKATAVTAPTRAAAPKATATKAKATPVAAKKAPKAAAKKSATATKGLPKKTIVAQPSGAKPKGTLIAKRSSGPARAPRESARDLYSGGDRKGHFMLSFIGPGLAIANRGFGAMMYDALGADYFFWEHLGIGLDMALATNFKHSTILSFVPHARYVWDLSSHPRWSIYVQGGVGVALANAKHAAADIAIPGAGFWWKWTDHFMIGADTSLHIYAGNGGTGVGYVLSPAFRYRF